MGNFNAKGITVIKIGSSTLTHPGGLVNIRGMEHLVKVISDIKNAGHQIVIVSSGAVAPGRGKLGIPHRPKDMPTKQAVASVGQCELMTQYQNMFNAYHHNVAQILLSRDVTDNADFIKNVRNTIDKLLEMGVVPIVNENDSICVDELAYGDNDTLSATVAGIIEAKNLVMLTDIDGLFTANPALDPDAELLSEVGIINDKIRSLAGASIDENGTGGMITKLEAASHAQDANIDSYIICGKNPENLYTLFEGKSIGTHIKKRSDCND